MNVEKFVSSIYLGDRACKGLSIDSWNQELSIHVDSISRVRSSDGNWNFYTSEDVENGHLVFVNVKKVFFDRAGYIPNDYINSLDVTPEEGKDFRFTLSIDSVSDDRDNMEVVIQIIAESLAIRDPMKPNMLIVE